MDTKERLMELLRDNPVVLGTAAVSATSLLRLADHLIDNGVTMLPTYGKFRCEFSKNSILGTLTLAGIKYEVYLDGMEVEALGIARRDRMTGLMQKPEYKRKFILVEK